MGDADHLGHPSADQYRAPLGVLGGARIALVGLLEEAVLDEVHAARQFEDPEVGGLASDAAAPDHARGAVGHVGDQRPSIAPALIDDRLHEGAQVEPLPRRRDPRHDARERRASVVEVEAVNVGPDYHETEDTRRWGRLTRHLPVILHLPLVAGNMRLRAARELGWEEVPMVFVDLDVIRARWESVALGATAKVAA